MRESLANDEVWSSRLPTSSPGDIWSLFRNSGARYISSGGNRSGEVVVEERCELWKLERDYREASADPGKLWCFFLSHLPSATPIPRGTRAPPPYKP